MGRLATREGGDGLGLSRRLSQLVPLKNETKNESCWFRRDAIKQQGVAASS
jgi:hypothetical protein